MKYVTNADHKVILTNIFEAILIILFIIVNNFVLIEYKFYASKDDEHPHRSSAKISLKSLKIKKSLALPGISTSLTINNGFLIKF